MGLLNLKEKAQERELRPVTTVTVEGEEMRFREPHSSDWFLPSDMEKRLRIDYPRFTEALASDVVRLARCYVPSEEEQEQKIDPLTTIATIANRDYELYIKIKSAFNVAFPPLRDWEQAKADVGNDLTE